MPDSEKPSVGRPAGAGAPPTRTYAAALQALQGAQKSSKGAPAYSRFFNRPAGRRLAAAAHVARRTPDQVTAASALCSLTAIVIVALVAPSWWVGLVVAFFLVLGYALDSADGQLARLRGGGSPAGEWLDHTVDAAKINLLHLAVAISVYRWFPLGDAWTLVPLAFMVVANVMFFGLILRDLIIARHRAGRPAPTPPVHSSTVRSLLVLPTDYGVLCLAFVVLGAPTLFLAVYGLLLVGTGGFLVLALPKWHRDVRREGS